MGLSGALFVALFVQWAVAQYRRAKIARAARDMIVTASLHNLRATSNMVQSVEKTLVATTLMYVRATLQLDTVVFRQLVTPEVMDALTPRESSLLIESLYGLSRMADSYDSIYRQVQFSIANPQYADIAIRRADGNWRIDVAGTTANLVNLLMFAVHCQNGSQISQHARELAAATEETRAAWRGIATGNEQAPDFERFAVVGRTSQLQGQAATERFGHVATVICWEHGWPDCPEASCRSPPNSVSPGSLGDGDPRRFSASHGWRHPGVELTGTRF